MNDHDNTKDNNEAMNLSGCCGLYCGLCSKYQSKAPSRCIGCRLGEQHSWCSIWNCCVKKHGYDTCTECSEILNCAIFLRRKVFQWIPAADNLRQINEIGLKNWLRKQTERQTLLEKLLQNYNEGRSMNFYCKICARMPIEMIHKAIIEVEEKLVSEKVDNSDIKMKASHLKEILKNFALEANINLEN